MNKLSYVFLTVLLVFVFASTSFADSTSSIDNVSANMHDINATVDSHQTFEAGKRAFVNPGNVQYGVLPGYFGDNSKPGHQFISLDKLMMYNTRWKVAKKAWESGIDFDYTPYTQEVAKDQRSEYITCTKTRFDPAKYDVQLLAVGTVSSSDKNIISSNLLSDVLYHASTFGATHVQFLAEGTNTELSSSGWGVGLAYTKATDTSVSSGGTGYSQGHSGYQNLPWQQFMFLKVTPKENNVKPVTNVEVPANAVVVDSSTRTNPQVEKAIQNSTIK